MMLKKLTKMISLCILLTAFAVAANAQVTVSGNVVDTNGQPVVGATILVVGTMNGTQTDFEGNWRLQVSDPQNDVLEFDCLGYDTIEEAVNNRAVINVILAESNVALEEVVFVGYGTQKRVDLTGSVTAIKFDEMAENRTIVSTSSALAGLSAGMQVFQTSSQPGKETSTIRIRGTGSFTSSASNPLVLVDGVEWSMDNVNPNDIESISVLKDAASTAIYGTRAANGVILITTKKGEEGKPAISYSYNAVWQTPYNKLKWVNDFADYAEYLNEANDMAGNAHTFSDYTISTWREKKKDPNGLNDYGVPNYMAYPNTDWFDALFSTGFSQQHQMSISGGSKGVRYMISGSYLDNTGIISKNDINSTSQKATFRANVEANVTDWFTIGTNTYAQFVALGTADVDNAFFYLSQTSPGIWPGEPDKWGRPASTEDSPNSNNIFFQASGTDGTQHTWKINSKVFATIRPYKGLSIEGDFNYAPTFTMNHTYSQPNGRWDYTTNTRYTSSDLADATVSDYTYRDYYVNTDVLIRYETVIKNDHELKVLLGMSTTDYKTWDYEVVKKGATDWSLNDGSTYSDLYSSDYTAREGWRLRSYFARVNYAFKNRYLFEANVRIDGSSVFGSENRYGVFPSFSAGWKIHDEPWMAGSRRWLDELKLRASWGETGNNQGLGYYTWQSTYNTGNVVVDGSNAVGLFIASMSNYDLKWETTSTLDIGVDAAFFNNRLTAAIDYYYKATRDILYTPSTYITMGNFSQVPSNLGNMWNQGIEVALNWKGNAGNDFYYWVGANVSYNANKVTNFKGRLEQGIDANGNFYTNYSDVAEDWTSPGVLIEGHAIGEHYIYKRYRGTGAGYSGGTVDVNAGPKDGMIRTEADMAWVRAMIDAGYTFNGQNTISKSALWYGDFIYADLNGDGNYGNSYDKYFTGKSETPTVNLGLNFGLSWKGIEFSMIWSGAFDYYLNWNEDFYNTSVARKGYSVSSTVAKNHYFYDPDNPSDSRTNINGKYPRLYDASGKNNEASDFYEYKGDYFKLKNVTVAYTLPEKWTKKAFISRLKFYVSGENLATISSYPGLDPEIGTEMGYPLMRQYTVGAQITF